MSDRVALSFDFDGVLARSPFAHGVLYPVLTQLAEARAFGTGDSVSSALQEVRERAWAEHRARTAAGDYVAAYDWEGIVRVVADDIGQAFRRSLTTMTRDFARALTSGATDSLLYPHAREVLSRLKKRGFCMLLLTNGYRDYQLPFLEALGLAGFFDAVFASDDLQSVKPFGAAFERAFRACGNGRGTRSGGGDGGGTPAGGLRGYHVGDSLTQDVAGARSAGIFAVWVHPDLPESLAGLAPRERAVSADLTAVLLAKLAHEETVSPGVRKDADFRPDAVISSLDELELVLDAASPL